MRPPSSSPSVFGLPRVVRAPLAFAVLAGLQLLALRHFDYSKAWLVQASVNEARVPRDPLALGELHWDPELYQRAPSLAPLRALVAQHCSERGPVATAECLTELFSRRFANGTPAHEFFDAHYSPAQELAEHLAGAPGHCVTRSGLLAATLLSAGFPARVVQMLPSTGRGHNATEVWDTTLGWVYIDPTYLVTVDGPPGTRSAAAALSRPAGDPRMNPAVRGVVASRIATATDSDSFATLMSGHLIYPDPWLYTRVGHRAAPAPFQGRFVVVGPASFRLGVVQPLLHVGIMLALLGLLGSTVAALARAGGRPAAPAVDLTRRVGPLQAHPAAVVVRPGRGNDVDPPGSAVA